MIPLESNFWNYYAPKKADTIIKQKK